MSSRLERAPRGGAARSGGRARRGWARPPDPPRRPPPASAPAERPARPRRRQATHDSSPASPLQRTVVRVLEVIPPELRVALGALAALGLILAAATFLQARRARRLERQRRRLVADVGLLQSALLPVLP